jgi:predicted phosphoribosyltransferase
MPGVSKRQREAMAIAEHHPEELYKKNRRLLKMSKQQLHDFAATKERDLPEQVEHHRKRRAPIMKADEYSRHFKQDQGKRKRRR